MFANPTNVGISQRVVATLVACAVVLASIGVYTHQAQAANLTQVSDTLSDSDGGVASNHTIVFTTTTGIDNGETIIINLSDGPFVNPGNAVDFTDVDVATTSDYTIAGNCAGAERVSAVFTAGPILTLTFCAGDGGSVPINGTTTIQIGTNATFGVAGNLQLTNPGTTGQSYEIVVTAGTPADTGRTRVAIVDDVLVTAIVDTNFDFTITGTATSTYVDAATTTGSTSPTLIAFGRLVADTPELLAQRLNVTTNARNGFSVTVETDGDLESANGATIDTFFDATDVTTPTTWQIPTNGISNSNQWGHWGVTTMDDVTLFDPGEYIAASTSPRVIFSHTGSANGTTNNIGSTTIGYKIEITPLQEAADDYQTILTYIATPTF
jgi:hypothetical protein